MQAIAIRAKVFLWWSSRTLFPLDLYSELLDVTLLDVILFDVGLPEVWGCLSITAGAFCVMGGVDCFCVADA